MFYCDDCSKKYGWPTSPLRKSLGKCEECKETAICNDVSTSLIVRLNELENENNGDKKCLK